ncbi:MAG: metallophosphoesterase [Clostridia bacterium]|nr:metallophosphoesterase [Clostridia bacterium]
MIYAMSDLHGCYDKYIRMLETIRFGDQDTLYILGDTVDRGKDGIRLLQDMMRRPNVIPLRGNHDYMAHRVLSRSVSSGANDTAQAVIAERQMWLDDGGAPTYTSFIALSPEEQARVLAYMNTFLIYDEVQAGGECYFLAHTVPEKEKMHRFETLM